MPDSVQFVFELRENAIQGFSVRVGGHEGGGNLALDLPEGADDETLHRFS